MREFYPLKYKIKLIGPSRQFEMEALADTCLQSSIIGIGLLLYLGYKEGNAGIIRFWGFTNIHRTYKTRVKIAAGGKKFSLDMVTPKEGFDIMTVVLGVDFLEKMGFLPNYLKDFSHLYTLIKQSKRKYVLVIGPDRKKEHIEILQRIKERLKKLGYEGILLKEYPDIREQSIEEKMNLFGSLAKFIICENSYPSGHIDELHICSRNCFVTIMLQKENLRGGATWMQASYPVDFPFVKRIFYNLYNFDSTIIRAVRVAESLVIERKNALNKIYKYREEWFKKLSKKG